jgi:hypothetical protein
MRAVEEDRRNKAMQAFRTALAFVDAKRAIPSAVVDALIAGRPHWANEPRARDIPELRENIVRRLTGKPPPR